VRAYLSNLLPIIRLEFYNKESSFYVSTNLLNEILIVFKNHFKYNFKILTCLLGVDYPENFYRFQIIYELLSIKFNSRIKLKIVVNELLPINSIEKIFPSAS